MPDRQRLRELATAQEPRAALMNLFFLSPGDEGVTEVLLIRHAQIEVSDDMGHDPPLTHLGVEQAEVLADYLARDGLDAIFSSPTRRARETVSPIARRQGLTPTILEALADVRALRPMDRPLPEMIAAELGADQVEGYIERMRREMSLDALAPFVESASEFRERTSRAIEAAIARHPRQRIAIVTHGPVIMSYAAAIIGTPRDFFINPKLTSITRVLARDSMRSLDYVNATPHFEA